MEDRRIVELYWERSEDAIRQTEIKYGRMLGSISYSLLSSREDAEECVSDTYVAAWNRMPTDKPDYLGAFLAKIVRSLSIDRYRAAHRQKRDGGVELILEELAECIPDSSSVESDYESRHISRQLNSFLAGLTEERRTIFILRYFNSEQISSIAQRMHMGEGRVKTILFRLRGELKIKLEREGLI